MKQDQKQSSSSWERIKSRKEVEKKVSRYSWLLLFYFFTVPDMFCVLTVPYVQHIAYVRVTFSCIQYKKRSLWHMQYVVRIVPLSYIRHLSYCFCIAIKWICVAISRVDGALKPWSAFHLGAGNSIHKPAYLDLDLFQLCKVCFGSWGGGNHYHDSTAETAMQQHVTEHGEHDKAQQKSWSPTAFGLSSKCPDTVLPLHPARSGRESDVDSAPLSPTLI